MKNVLEYVEDFGKWLNHIIEFELIDCIIDKDNVQFPWYKNFFVLSV
jgi:hypothetical protein